MAFKLPADADSQASALGRGIDSKMMRRETPPGSLGYIAGSPDKRATPEYTGDTMTGNLGEFGEFGTAVNDVTNEPAQRFAGDFMQRYLNGIFAPGGEMA